MKNYSDEELLNAAEKWLKSVREKNLKLNYLNKETKSIKQSLGKLKKEIHKQSKNTKTDWNNIWNDVVGEEIANLSRVKRWHNGFLEIIVDNPALRSELDAFYKESLIESLKAQFEDKIILRDIKFISN